MAKAPCISCKTSADRENRAKKNRKQTNNNKNHIKSAVIQLKNGMLVVENTWKCQTEMDGSAEWLVFFSLSPYFSVRKCIQQHTISQVETTFYSMRYIFGV